MNTSATYSDYTPHYLENPTTVAELCHNLRTYAADMEYAERQFPWHLSDHPQFGACAKSGYDVVFGRTDHKARDSFVKESHWAFLDWETRATFCLLYAEYLESEYPDTSISLYSIQ